MPEIPKITRRQKSAIEVISEMLVSPRGREVVAATKACGKYSRSSGPGIGLRFGLNATEPDLLTNTKANSQTEKP